jgi:3-deoxy-D-manno-octulosonate 8-phosphate phosphatase (KDO 8-P phosphatase)
MSSSDLSSFKEGGALFGASEKELKKRIASVRMLIFDWDGVFNNGFKDSSGSSSFSEIDSMGINLLRYGFYRSSGNLPRAYVLSGASNASARAFAEREHFDGVYLNHKNKLDAFQRMLEKHRIKKEETAFFFDDVLDLGVAEQVGFRVFMGNGYSSAFSSFVQKKKLWDLIPARSGKDHALRESCDLMLTALGIYDEVLEDRLNFTEAYSDYWKKRQSIPTRYQEAQ